MRTRSSVLLLGSVAMLAACTQPVRHGAVAPSTSPAERTSTHVVVLGTPNGVTAIDPTTGSVLFSAAGVPALADWSMLFSATPASGGTVLQARRASSGALASSTNITGQLAIRVVSDDGQDVALMAPLPAGRSPWTLAARTSTSLVIADPSGALQPRRYHLKGNFEPEAFAADDQSLFMIRYIPAARPVAYRVVRLDLADGDVYAVFGRQKSPVETMTGTRLMQVPSPTGARLFTLYTNQPPEYAKGFNAAQATAGHSVAFVHTLALDEGWAICVGLPKALWGGEADRETMAVSPDGGRLYVVDAARGVVAVVDTDRMKVVGTAAVGFGVAGDVQPRATVSPDGTTLLVANGATIVRVDAATLRPMGTWPAPSVVSGLGFDQTGDRLYVAMPGRVETLDPVTGSEIGMTPAPVTAGPTYVEAVAA